MATSLRAYEGAGEETARLVAGRLKARGEVKLGERGNVTPGKVEEIVGRSWGIAADAR